MKNIIILLSLIFSVSAKAEIIRNKTTVSVKEIKQIQEENKYLGYPAIGLFADDGAERLRIFKDQGTKELNRGSNSQALDVRIPLIWYVHVF